LCTDVDPNQLKAASIHNPSCATEHATLSHEMVSEERH
jgi:hypothetical protein